MKMDSVSYIINRINQRFLNCHWVFIVAAIFYEAWLWTSPPPVRAVLLAALLGYWCIWTWPKRWLLDLVLVWCAGTQIILWVTTSTTLRGLVQK